MVCAQVSGQVINLSKGKDKRDTLLLVIGHCCLLCSFPWKIALGKAGYFQHCISDLDKHLRIHQSVGISLYEWEIQNVHQWDEVLEQPHGGLLLLWNVDSLSLATVTRHSKPVSLDILPMLKQFAWSCNKICSNWERVWRLVPFTLLKIPKREWNKTVYNWLNFVCLVYNR